MAAMHSARESESDRQTDRVMGGERERGGMKRKSEGRESAWDINRERQRNGERKKVMVDADGCNNTNALILITDPFVFVYTR